MMNNKVIHPVKSIISVPIVVEYKIYLIFRRPAFIHDLISLIFFFKLSDFPESYGVKSIKKSQITISIYKWNR